MQDTITHRKHKTVKNMFLFCIIDWPTIAMLLVLNECKEQISRNSKQIQDITKMMVTTSSKTQTKVLCQKLVLLELLTEEF